MELEKIINSCRLNDRQAQKMLYEHFYGLVMSVTLRYAGSFEEAKELTNDIFYKIFTKLDFYLADTNFRSWLLKVAHRNAIDHYRKEINKPEIFGDSFIPVAEQRCDLEILNRLEVEEKIKLIQKLSPVYRIVFNLYVIEEYTHDEIAKELGISVGTSKSNLFKARNQLKNLIEKYQLT